MGACIHRVCNIFGLVGNYPYGHTVMIGSTVSARNCKTSGPQHWADIPGPPAPPDLAEKMPRLVKGSDQIIAVPRLQLPPVTPSDKYSTFSPHWPPDTPRTNELQVPRSVEPEPVPGTPFDGTIGAQGRTNELQVPHSAASILHLAVQYPSNGPLRSILRAQADVHTCDCHGVTALHVAALCGRPDAAKALLDARAHVEAAAVDGSLPLHVAARSGCIDVLHLLLDGKADLESRDVSGSCALHFACDFGHSEVVEMLLEAGASCQAEDAWQRTPLHRAAFGGSLGLIETLLLHGCDAAQSDAFGHTPIDIAIQNNNGGIVVNLWKSCSVVSQTQESYVGACRQGVHSSSEVLDTLMA